MNNREKALFILEGLDSIISIDWNMADILINTISNSLEELEKGE